MRDITFVDHLDNVIGWGSKIEALEGGIAHRIVRIFIFDRAGNVLLQKRAAHVMSNPGKWDQSAAGHVDAGEDYDEAAYRELREELGIEGMELTPAGKFYAEERDEACIKKRFNTVYFGTHEGPVNFGADEVSEVAWVPIGALFVDNPEYTEGFSECVSRFADEIRNYSEATEWRSFG